MSSFLAESAYGQARSRRVSNAVFDGWLVRADQAIARGQVPRAVSLLEKAARFRPTDPRAPIRLAETSLPPTAERAMARTHLALASSARRALSALSECRSADPATARDIRLARAWGRALAGEIGEAIAEIEVADFRLDSRARDVAREISALAVRRGDLALADRAIEVATRIDPQDPTLLSDQAAIHLARGQSHQAIALFRQVLQTRPDDPSAIRDLAGALLAVGDSEAALALFVRVRSTCPNDARCHLDVALAALEAHEFEQAVREADEALRLAASTDPNPSLVLAAAHSALGHSAETARAFREALRRDPRSARAREGLRALAQ